jgi:hypothetical protein
VLRINALVGRASLGRPPKVRRRRLKSLPHPSPQYSSGDRSQRAGKDGALCDQCARVSGLDEVIDGLRLSGRSRHSRPRGLRFDSVTVDASGGWPFIRIVIFAPTANGPSILAISMTSPRHSAGFVHTAHISSALAEEWDDPPNGPFASPMSVIFPRLALPLCKTGNRSWQRLREEHFKPMYESSMYRKAKLPRDLAGALECALLEGVVDLAAR